MTSKEKIERNKEQDIFKENFQEKEPVIRNRKNT